MMAAAGGGAWGVWDAGPKMYRGRRRRSVVSGCSTLRPVDWGPERPVESKHLLVSYL